jgi:hypothetical protein
MRRCTRIFGVLMFWTLALTYSGTCFAQTTEEKNWQKTISKLEAYPGLHQAVVETLAEDKARRHSIGTVYGVKHEVPCANVAFTKWTSSSHPGGNKPKKNGEKSYNEDNDGIGFKCYLSIDENGRVFLHVDALENSKFGSTITAGLGWEIDILLINPFNVYAGGSLNLTYYEVKGRLRVGPNEYLYKTLAEWIIPHPSFHAGVGLDIQEATKLLGVYLPIHLGMISFEEQNLLGKARIRSFGWQYRTRF